MHSSRNIFINATFLVILAAGSAFGQGTEFTYQGRLLDGSLPANASYDFEFRLFDVAAGGMPLAVQTRANVPVTTGIFGVTLDFGASFDGGARWLEIAVKAAGSPNPATVLAPRQPLTSSPYSIRSLSSSSADSLSPGCIGCVQDANINAVSGAKVTGQILVASIPQGSGHYIQNTIDQQSGDFNIDGNGALGGTLSAAVVTAPTITATSQFNLGVNRILAVGTAGIFAGRLAGVSNTTGSGNTFVGDSAGRFNATGSNNSFFGRDAGLQNTASDNSFFGAFAGDSNTTGTRNSFFGRTAGDSNQSGSDNAFFGNSAGRANTGSENAFFGSRSGEATTTGSANSFFGYQAGALNVTGSLSTFFGYQAGRQTTVGENSFFGAFAGDANTTGVHNAFFGKSAGSTNVTGHGNSFFGYFAGQANTANGNSFFGHVAGASNTSGTRNSFFGAQAGQDNSSSNDNSFFGALAGGQNSTGINNSFFGSNSGYHNKTGHNNAFFGTGAGFNNTSNFNSFFGSRAGEFNTTGTGNSFFGYRAGNANDGGFSNTFVGEDSGIVNTEGSSNVFVGKLAGENNTTGDSNTFVGRSAGNGNLTGNNNTTLGRGADVNVGTLQFATAIGAGAIVSTSNTVVLGRNDGSDKVKIFGLGAAGSTELCRNANSEISTCSSSLRYKTDVNPFLGGLSIVRRLRPITFTWRYGENLDLGFAAEEVEAVEPLLTTYRDGQVEGVKYAQITTVLVNAINEQQQIIEDQQKRIDALMQIVCATHPDAEPCREKGGKP